MISPARKKATNSPSQNQSLLIKGVCSCQAHEEQENSKKDRRMMGEANDQKQQE